MPAVLITCEHATNFVPLGYRERLGIPQDVLESHRGWDAGALELAERLAGALGAQCFLGGVSRLVVDLNRSPENPAVWSEYTRELPVAERAKLMSLYYSPYRLAVHEAVEKYCHAGTPVVHLSIHSFTPIWDGQKRPTDIGILFDPARQFETAIASQWRAALQSRLPAGIAIHDNQPYKGTDDGLTTLLRTFFEDRLYAGIELEVNQRFPLGSGAEWESLCAAIVAAACI